MRCFSVVTEALEMEFWKHCTELVMNDGIP